MKVEFNTIREGDTQICSDEVEPNPLTTGESKERVEVGRREGASTNSVRLPFNFSMVQGA